MNFLDFLGLNLAPFQFICKNQRLNEKMAMFCAFLDLVDNNRYRYLLYQASNSEEMGKKRNISHVFLQI